ncbi:hypothetical protein OB2597_19571 [Pseudooceanicola batsensis HTCC2597]|uniref:Integral membrane protein n=1 Tax=Pseudooceanicola batsensis (strain ATCC BAA-863 / DSM 15984 / KCTC 12145 / HTCC2597) TaxID=252305 RepID=A3U0M4_PSEBH|nr:anthrone oxygenase family protein [Pseudooceanicola batsensis]EAQ02315.1 hypothetical protein OB2597_19571 [Pseudooceanicola batsensis HTCC2597]
MTWLLLVCGLAMALVAGVFLSFSDFVMRGLVLAPGTGGAAGMIGLNRTVYRSVFMVLLMGFLPGSLALSLLTLWQSGGAAPALVAAGGLVYFLGVVGITGVGNVPMNKRLETLEGDARGLADYWPRYARRWTGLNHLRTGAAVLAALLWLTAATLV